MAYLSIGRHGVSIGAVGSPFDTVVFPTSPMSPCEGVHFVHAQGIRRGCSAIHVVGTHGQRSICRKIVVFTGI